MASPTASARLLLHRHFLQDANQNQHQRHLLLLRPQREARLGLRDIPREVPPHAGLHALHVWRRRPDLLHGHRLYAPLQPI